MSRKKYGVLQKAREHYNIQNYFWNCFFPLYPPDDEMLHLEMKEEEEEGEDVEEIRYQLEMKKLVKAIRKLQGAKGLKFSVCVKLQSSV